MPKKMPGPRKAKGRPKATNPKPVAPVAVTLRGRQEWVDWLESACASIDTLGTGIDRTQLFDVALRLLAEKHGLSAPPSRL